LISSAWNISPSLAAEIPNKFKLPVLHTELIRLITSNPLAVINSTSALEEVINQKCNISSNYGFRVRISFNIYVYIYKKKKIDKKKFNFYF